jgi:hypothetical protein
MATSAEQLILRGLHLIMRASFSPNDPAAQAKHFMSIQNDLGPWFADYATEIEKPAVDAIPAIPPREAGGSGVQS